MVLDIGGDRGALVVWVPPSLDGHELELRRVEVPWQGRHTAVRPRDLGIGRRFAAVFGTLVEGRYQARVRGTDSPPVIEAEVAGGSIAEVVWPGRPLGPSPPPSVEPEHPKRVGPEELGPDVVLEPDRR